MFPTNFWLVSARLYFVMDVRGFFFPRTALSAVTQLYFRCFSDAVRQASVLTPPTQLHLLTLDLSAPTLLFRHDNLVPNPSAPTVFNFSRLVSPCNSTWVSGKEQSGLLHLWGDLWVSFGPIFESPAQPPTGSTCVCKAAGRSQVLIGNNPFFRDVEICDTCVDLHGCTDQCKRNGNIT